MKMPEGGTLEREGIRRIAVFRALMLGDLLCAVPALRALRGAFPQADITLVGLPWAEALAARLDCVDDFIAFPGFPGLPEIPCEIAALPEFLKTVQEREFDLAVQLHGSGFIVNPLVAAFGARHMAGFFDERAWYPVDDARNFVPWPEKGHEIERLLGLTDALGAPRQGLALEFPVGDADRRALDEAWPERDPGRPYVCVHPGAQLASRRWPPERFAAVADDLAKRGYTVVLTGSATEAELVARVEAAMRQPVLNFSGRTSLWTLGALIEGAEFVVCNDTGISHIAAALRRPTVVISNGADVSRWAPLDHQLHTVLWQPVPCRPCAFSHCPFEHACALGVEVPKVLSAVQRLTRRKSVDVGVVHA